jgi:hypothetical protein
LIDSAKQIGASAGTSNCCNAGGRFSGSRPKGSRPSGSRPSSACVASGGFMQRLNDRINLAERLPVIEAVRPHVVFGGDLSAIGAFDDLPQRHGSLVTVSEIDGVFSP